HVPLHGEAEAAEVDGLGNTGECGGLFGNGESAGHGVRLLVEAAQEVDSFEVLVAPVLVRYPLAGLAGIVEIEHGGDGVDTQAVDVKFLEPEERIGNEEG